MALKQVVSSLSTEVLELPAPTYVDDSVLELPAPSYAFTAIVQPKDLQRFVKVAHPLVSRKNLPILQTYHLECHPGGVTLTVCDGETWLSGSFPAMTEGLGSCLIHARTFKDALASAAKQSDLTIEHLPGEGVKIGAFRLQSMEACDYPRMPDTDNQTRPCKLPAGAFEPVQRFMSADPHRSVLCGVKVDFEEALTRLVATDTHRLGVHTLQGFNTHQAACIVSSAAVGICRRAGGDITLRIPDDSAMWTRIEVGGFLISSNTQTRGQYPNWERVLPDKLNATRIYNIGAKDLRAAIATVATLAKDNANRIRLSFDGETLTITGRSEQRGEASASCQFLGMCGPGIDGDLEPWECALNCLYALEAIDALNCDGIRLYATENTRPVLLTDYDRDDTQVVIMPMQLS